MRKWITALLIVTMVLTAGCGQKGTDQGAAGERTRVHPRPRPGVPRAGR